MSQKGSAESAPSAADAKLAVVSPDPPTTSILPGGSEDEDAKEDPFADALAHVLSDSTRRAYKGTYVNFAKHLLKVTKRSIPEDRDEILAAAFDLIPQTTFRVVQDYRDGMIANGMSSATVTRHLSALTMLFDLVVVRGLMLQNPAESRWVKRPRVVRVKIRKNLEPAEISLLLDAAAADSRIYGTRDLALIAFGICTGYRRGELVRAHCDKLQRVQDIPVIDVLAKGDKMRRVEIIEPAWSLLMEWAKAGDITEGYLFRPIRNGHVKEGPLSKEAVHKIIVKRAKEAGLENVSPHVLRHTHITLALRGGAKLEDVQRWVGHSDPKTTAGYYHNEEFVGKSPARLIDLSWTKEGR